MRHVWRLLIPQRLRLRLWLAYSYFTPGSFRRRRAQPSLLQTTLARMELARRAGTGRGGLGRLSGVRLINLPSRPDRLRASLAEFHRVGLERVDILEAFQHEDGLLGSGRSHRRCVEEMIEREWTSMLVCEDDIEFLLNRRQLDVLVDAFLDDDTADVACLAYFVWESRPHNRLYLRGLSVQTAACYLVKRRIAESLLDVWADGIAGLERGGDRGVYAHDRIWTRLQRGRVFLVPTVRAARQRPGYSDIQRRSVAYGH